MAFLYHTYMKMILHRKRFYLCNLIFPIAFAVLLFYVVRNVNQIEEGVLIRVAIIVEENESACDELIECLQYVKNSENELVFDIVKEKEIDAKKELQDESIVAYIKVDDEITLVVNSNGMKQKVVANYLNQYKQLLQLYKETGNIGEVHLQKEYLSLVGEGPSIIDQTIIEQKSWWLYFYTLIGLSLFLCGDFGLFLARMIFSDQSDLAARLSFLPVGKGKRFISGLCASFSVSILSIALLLWFISYFYGIPIGLMNPMVWIVIVIGILLSILLGYCLGGFFRQKQTWRESFAIVLVILCSFLAGIVDIKIKYLMQQKLGLAIYLNPVHVMSDALYYLNCNNNMQRYLVDVVMLLFLLFVNFIGAMIFTGRRTYDHI